MSKLGKFAAACAGVLCAFGAFGGSDYRFAEYIERNNSSTISTGVKITANTTKVEFGVQDSLGETATHPLVGETDSTSTIGIFSGNGIRAPAGVRFYGMRIWEQGVLVHHLVPCYQRRDATTRQLLETPIPGVYDRVTGTFKAGTGTIVCGPDVPLPGLMILVK